MMSRTSKVLCCLCVILWICEARYVKELEVRDNTTKTVFELEEYLTGAFYGSTWNGTWISDTTFLYRNSIYDVVKYDMETKESEVFLPRSVMSNFTGSSYTLSKDQSYVLIKYNVSTVFRHSTTAQFAIYDIANAIYYHVANGTSIQLASFAPAGHGLVYVYENNIYYLEDFAVDVDNPVTVTNIGVTGVIYCGVPDWVYEEEVLGSGSALWVSPNATHIAYATFHDENVTDFTYYTYGTAGTLDAQYPKEATIKYPKVGTLNPTVAVYIYDISTGETVEFQLPETIDNKLTNDYVLYDLTWVSDTEVAMISTNRVQNKAIIIRCNSSGLCDTEDNYEEANGWLSPSIPKYSKDGTKRLEILPQPEGEDQFFHIVLTDIENNAKTRLTQGKKVVTTIYGWDEDNGLVYYGGTAVDTPSQQHIYVVTTEGVDTCLSCDMEVDGAPCEYATGSFSTSFSYHVKVCSGPNPTYVRIDNTKNAADTIVWQDNASLRSRLALKHLPIIRKLVVPINEQFNARVKLVLPHNLDESGNTKYPAIVNVYAGPNSNQISDAFSVGIQYYFATNRQYIYIYIDGRGSGRDGHNKMFQIYRNLATLEIEDQIAVTKYLQENLPYIDANRTGIWGWSYGGFASSWALVKDTQHVFNFALAVAPVTSFIYYDTIYTERYMGLPTAEDNELGYNNTDLSRNAEAFRGRRYFIIHGNADDNVHYQNSMVLARALELADIDFRQQSYPDEAHSLTSVTRHLYHTIDKYFARCFDVETPPIVTWNQKEHNS